MTTVRSPRWWSAALTLSERASLARVLVRRVVPNARASTVNGSVDRWRRQRPFDRDDFLARRLALDLVSEAELEVLASSADELAPADAPDWITTVERAAAVAPDIDCIRGTEPMGPPDDLDVARAFVEPFVTIAMSRLFAKAIAIREANPHAPFDAEQATKLFEYTLWGHLIGRAAKVVILELNVARIEGSLTGETPEQRCADFARQLRCGPARDRLIAEYPVLIRSIVTAADFWEQAAAEFLEHLAADAAAVSEQFFEADPLGTLDAVLTGVGDGHRHGRSVIVARFSTGKRVVYKPRPLDVDIHFAELIDWLNARGTATPLRAVRTMTIGGHGWSEFIANTPCTSTEEVGRFYERFGAYIAVLHALEATDFHYENVIASGEHPMLIDLEALFHPRSDSADESGEPESVGWHTLQHSVLRAGVLPFRVPGSDESHSLDLSAVGGRGGQLSPSKFPVLVDGGTDAMRFSRRFVHLPETQNRPALGADPIDPTRYAHRVTAGFTATYRLLVRHRDELIAPGGPLRRFADDSIRVVLRPTRQYALLLSESHHPDVLRDALDRDRLFDRLWIAVVGHPEFERIIAFEHADMVNGDVPLFATKPSSKDLFTTHGNVVAGYFQRSGLDAALHRIASMGEEDLVRQQWVVQASLVALEPGQHGSKLDLTTRALELQSTSSSRRARSATQLTAPSSAECLDTAALVRNRLIQLALRDRNRISWLGLALARERDWVIQPVGADLYDGTAGIALFLAYLDEIVADDSSIEIARTIVAQIVRRVEATIASLGDSATLPTGAIGAFGPLGGSIYALAHIGALWNDRGLIETADRLAAAVAPHVTHDRQLDLINGTAGFIMAAAALDHVLPSGGALAAIRVGADALVERAMRLPNGYAWTTTLPSTQPLSGASHGASGMALALATAGSLLRNASLTDVALEALRYERSTFDSARGNWPDYRVLDAEKPPTSPGFMWSWCHGAPGIGLMRLALSPYLQVPELRADLEHALQSTAAFGFGSNDSLCHGDLGNLELFVRARELGHSGAWERTLATESARIVDHLRRGESRCGIPGGVETPGLMMGLAGIGYGLIRLGAPTRVPSILSLERPRSAICPRSDR